MVLINSWSVVPRHQPNRYLGVTEQFGKVLRVGYEMGLSCAENPIAGASRGRLNGRFRQGRLWQCVRAGGAASGSLASITMVKPSNRRQTDNLPSLRWLHESVLGTIVVE